MQQNQRKITRIYLFHTTQPEKNKRKTTKTLVFQVASFNITRAESPLKIPCTYLCPLSNCMQTLYEFSPHFPSFHFPKNLEETSLKIQPNTASFTCPATRLEDRFCKANGKLIFTPFFILFFIQFFSSLTFISLLEMGLNSFL